MEKNDYYFSYTNYIEIDENSFPNGKRITGPKRITRNGMFSYCWPGCLTVMYDAEIIGLIQIEDIKKKAPVYSSSKVAQTYYARYKINTTLNKYGFSSRSTR